MFFVLLRELSRCNVVYLEKGLAKKVFLVLCFLKRSNIVNC